jgi:predicted phosphodiesterase
MANGNSISTCHNMTKILVISDIHANYSALQAVLNDAPDYDSVWCLGDLVGYGPDPNDCIQEIRNLPKLVCLLGNHDAAVLGNIDIDAFNREASISAVWARENLEVENVRFLQKLPDFNVVGDVTLVHGSPRNPVWEYLLDTYSAEENFNYFDTKCCFVGHTHIPLVYYRDNWDARVHLKQFQDGNTFQIGSRAILNPGSVGQPRDYDPRAAYAIFDVEKRQWESHRVSYDIQAVQKRILDAGLPARHAERLLTGW